MCLYVTSKEAGTGKTTICAGLGIHLEAKGKKVGFFRPILGDGDAGNGARSGGLFMQQVLGLDEDIKDICPVFADKEGMVGQVREAYARIAAGKDVVFTEGAMEPGLIQELGARVIAVEGYSGGSSVGYGDAFKGIGESLIGVVLNMVPVSRLERVRAEVVSEGDVMGEKVLAVIPEDRILLAPSIAELAEWLQGEILNSVEQSAELVESIMIGAMTVDPGPQYYSRRKNKAVVVRGERPDMQLAALETGTRCLVVCGDTPLAHEVLYEAERQAVPIIRAKGDIAGAVAGIEEALGRSRFGQEKKLPRLAEVMGQYFNMPAFYQGAGITA